MLTKTQELTILTQDIALFTAERDQLVAETANPKEAERTRTLYGDYLAALEKQRAALAGEVLRETGPQPAGNSQPEPVDPPVSAREQFFESLRLAWLTWKLSRSRRRR